LIVKLKQKKRWQVFWVVALFALLAACSSPEAPAATPTLHQPTPTTSATSLPPVGTPTTSLQPTATQTPIPTLEPGYFANPVLDQDFPDPDVLQVGEVFFAFSTNADGRNIPTARSYNLIDWEVIGDALPVLPVWAVQDFGWAWAPDVSMHEDGITYLIYFTARLRIGDSGGIQCIGAAAAIQPEGPYNPLGDQPVVCQQDEGGSIDPAVFIDDDGSRYLLWKNDGNAYSGRTWIYIQPLADDGLNLTGEAVRLLEQSAVWEGPLVEGPTLIREGDTYFLFYSANDYASPRYAVGLAYSDDLTGPYTKLAEPLLQSSIPQGRIGPGGQDIVRSDSGSDWILFHSWSPQGYRFMNLEPLVWEDGLPVVRAYGRVPQPGPLIPVD
jgi:arabinan endo-1,5-alpha-L-arabinosidase